MTSIQHLGENGNLHHLAQRLGNPDTTIVSGKRCITPETRTLPGQRIYPDVLVSSTPARSSTAKTTAKSPTDRANHSAWTQR